jgi:hypothetical protein
MKERKIKYETGTVNKITVLMYSYRKNAASLMHTREITALRAQPLRARSGKWCRIHTFEQQAGH